MRTIISTPNEIKVFSVISDTTIAAVRTQGCNMKDKFKQNFFIVLPAAIVTLIIFFVRTGQMNVSASSDLEYEFIKVVPYLVVLIGALIGFNVFAVLFTGIALSMAIGIGTGAFSFFKGIQACRSLLIPRSPPRATR